MVSLAFAQSRWIKCGHTGSEQECLQRAGSFQKCEQENGDPGNCTINCNGVTAHGVDGYKLYGNYKKTRSNGDVIRLYECATATPESRKYGYLTCSAQGFRQSNKEE